jgi:ABC-type lipoprotein release transport system permease subunit
VAFLVMRFAGSIFYGVSPTDPVIYTLAALAMAAAAIAASYIPARRATVVDPVETLRAE